MIWELKNRLNLIETSGRRYMNILVSGVIYIYIYVYMCVCDLKVGAEMEGWYSRSAVPGTLQECFLGANIGESK